MKQGLDSDVRGVGACECEGSWGGSQLQAEIATDTMGSTYCPLVLCRWDHAPQDLWTQVDAVKAAEGETTPADGPCVRTPVSGWP